MSHVEDAPRTKQAAGPGRDFGGKPPNKAEGCDNCGFHNHERGRRRAAHTREKRPSQVLVKRGRDENIIRPSCPIEPPTKRTAAGRTGEVGRRRR